MSIRRLLVYLVAGILLCTAGVLLMLVGSIRNNPSERIAGVLFYAAAIPLLFQAKLTKLESRIDELERRIRDRRPEV